MAVETNKRKRKLKNESNGVPKKKSKNDNNSEAPAENMNEEEEHQVEVAAETAPEKEVEEETTNDSGFEPDQEDNMKFSKDFKMLNFRTKLRGQDFITELRHFLHLASTKPQIIAKYIEKRGKPLELAEALERVDKSNIFHVSYICQALHLVVMEILSNQKSHLESAISACRYFLKSHGAVLETLLKSNNLNHRKCALKLLTAIVCTEPQLGRQLLTSFDILSNVKEIENFLSHSKYELHENDTVRKCYIHFILAYLVDGNTLLIRNILDKGVLIKALASGLLFDDPVTVCVVISTLKKYVLECPEISKTKKITVFDVDCVKSFARLYDWLGPNALAAKFSQQKESSGHINFGKLLKYVDPKEKESVVEVVHEFLLMLLTSRKHGITFDAMAHFQQRHNKLQGKIIGFLDKPWLSEKKTELVLSTIRACPDIARNTVKNFGVLVSPLRNYGTHWNSACDFLTKIIDELHPKLLKGALAKITLTDFSHWVKDICLPIEVLTHLTQSKALKHLDFQHRLSTNRLLLAMFRQYSNYMAAIIHREQQKKNNLRRFKFDLLNHIFVNFPTIEDILFSLFATIQTQQNEGVDVLQHLELTLDLVLIICQQNRSFVNKTATIMDYLNLLRPLYASENGGGNIKLELKAIKTILFLFPKALEPQEELFGNVMKSFINAFVKGDAEISNEAGHLLRGIFQNTGIFDTAEMEIDLWLEALRFVPPETVDIVAAVFIEVLQVTKADVDPMEMENENENAIEVKHLSKLFSNIEKGLSVQGYVETPTMSKLYALIKKGVEIGDELGDYLQLVRLLISHFLDNGNNETLKDVKVAEMVPNLIAVQEAVGNGQLKFDEIFQHSKNNFTLTLIDGKEIQFDVILQNDRLVMIYIQEVMSILSHLTKTESLTMEESKAAANFMVNLLKVLQALSISQKTVVEVSLEEDKDVIRLSYLEKTLKYLFNTRLGMIQTTHLFNRDKCNLSYLHFLQQITDCVNSFEMSSFSDFTMNFRQKIVNSIKIATTEEKQKVKKHSEELQSVISLVKTFQLTSENCLEILENISTLSYEDFVGKAGQRCIFLDILNTILERLSDLKQSVKCDESVSNIAQIYIDLVIKSDGEINLERLEDALHGFLSVCHQYISKLPSEMFKCIFSHRKLTKSTIRLACLLLERNSSSLKDEFIKILPENISKKELTYPLLSIAFTNGIQLEDSILTAIYQEYKNGFMKTIEKPQKAGVIYKENVQASIHLIAACMPKSECMDFCNKNIKFDSVEVFQVKIIQAIFQKALDSFEDRENSELFPKIFVQFVNLCIQMLTIVLKKDALDEEKITLIGFLLFKWMEANSELEVDFEKILKSQNWMNFCKAALKAGMFVSETEENQPELERINGELLKLLAFLVNRIYEDKEDSQEARTLFEMIFTHSKFLKIVLEIHPTAVKTQIMHLLFVLAKKSPSALATNQIAVVLAAYQAKLTDCDRYTLALLQLYEEADIGLHEYRPFIWGESAIAFYSLRDDQQEKSNLQYQETSVAQVMSLIDRQVSEYTLNNFPIWRKLDPSSQLPQTRFENPELVHLAAFGTNFLERRIEQGDCEFAESELRLCPKRDNHYHECYDPAFIIPLMSMCFAPEIYTQPVRPVQNGLLSVVFAALSSQDKEMRMAAGCVHLRYRSHFENSKFYEKPLWQQAYDNIQSGLDALRSDWLKHKKNGGIPRVPYISGLFLAKTINLTTDPTNTLYKQLTMFLRLKESFNFLCVPEFNVLFHSPEVEHHTFRQFIVEIIRNGVRSSSDLFLLVTTSTFKALMGFYASSMSTLDINLQILSVLSTCVKIPGSSKIMVEHVGVIPWLNGLLTAVEFYHFDIIEGIISIINNLWYAIKANKKSFHNFQHIQSDLNRLILRLLPNLSGRISMRNFAKLMNILNKTTTGDDIRQMVSEVQLDRLIGCGQKLYGEELFNCIVSIKQNGPEGAESYDKYCRTLALAKTEESAMIAVCSLREFVLKWSRTK
ncbi:uncharacterized protein LOC129918317 [Episyrphus balteatus]|uniref:uncharacterized protein LOC129918317 n=1 Tax=Episyrphus balteatus TaxID=286459 RepID=UPI002485E6E9|nr:uncharacterized protein LOC129918317 [Episyrphus balteatus]